MFQTSALEILYGGQFTLSTQLIKSLPPLFKSELVLRGVIFLRNCGTLINKVINNYYYYCYYYYYYYYYYFNNQSQSGE